MNKPLDDLVDEHTEALVDEHTEASEIGRLLREYVGARGRLEDFMRDNPEYQVAIADFFRFEPEQLM